jgi:hypothetical protein
MGTCSLRIWVAAAFIAATLLTRAQMRAESTTTCPAGQYDMLDWMTLDSDLQASHFLQGNANPLYTTKVSTKFYWTKGASGYPWDIQLYDSNYIYLWITEWTWGNPYTFKKFALNNNMPLAPRCAKAGYPGSAVKAPNTYYEIHTSCKNYTLANLKYAVNEVWGPYYYSLGGSLPANMKTLVVSYRYNCNSSYGNCGDKEEYYLGQRYGLVQWVHYTLSNGTYVQRQKSVFNKLASGKTTPYFPCF